jgi:anti-sigma regulatory factor (Ser/Thr protein kinase)
MGRVTRFTLHLPHDPDSIPVARRELQRLSDEVDDLTLRNTKLLVSELVTNAVRHVPAGDGDEIELVVERADGHVRVEVADRGPGFEPTPRADVSTGSSGWGLHIMAKLASRWGVEVDEGSRVWFELEVEQAG